MSNTMPSWEEWNKQLTQEQRDYSLYKILQSMDQKLSNQSVQCGIRIAECSKRFDQIERHKWLNRGISASSSFLGGFVAVLASMKFKIFNG